MKINGGKCLKEALKLRGITATQMARDFGIYRQHVDRWKNADDIRISKAQVFADYLNMHVLDFLKLGEEHEEA